MNQTSFSQPHWQVVEAAKKAHPTDKLSVIGGWVATIIVWLVVIGLGMAVAGFILGEE